MIEIPGYKVIKQLGRGGMATVYLAIQQSVDREVALKVMSPALLVDPNFGERFLREARIAAKLHHRHVVGVHDVGKSGDVYYMAMEHISGGSVVKTDGEPVEVPFALRATREIAMALGYAHSKGFVHRDVKPDNMLMREDGTVVLTDFGIARANDSATRMTRTGSVVGTPHYMSPEQARGRQIDGRADLYSLGIVLYELLMGRVPFIADDSLAVGIMHITQPVPRLPDPLSPLQALLDLMLAKTPEERIQTGEDLVEEIRKMEIAIAEGKYPSLAKADAAWRHRIAAEAKLAAVRTVQVDAITRKENAASKSDPSIGATDDLNLDLGHRRPIAQVANKWVWPALLGVLILLGGGYAFRNQLSALLPEPEVNRTLNRAEVAITEGKLLGTAESAKELFEGVLRIDPDNARAAAGLKQVGSQLLEATRVALRDNNLERARQTVSQAREILQGGEALTSLEQEILKAAASTAELGQMLAAAQKAFDANNLMGNDNSAWAIYSKVLDGDMTNSLALSGQTKIMNSLATRAELLIGSEQFEEANLRLKDIESVNPNFSKLAELRARLSDAENSVKEKKTSLIEEADQLLARGKIAEGGRNAVSIYQELLKTDPDNADAKRGLNAAAQALGERAQAAFIKLDLEQTARNLQLAQSLGWNPPQAKSLSSALREAREKRDISRERNNNPVANDIEITRLLAAAEAAMQRGDLLEPPGDNAWDLYRRVLRMQQSNAKAKSGLTVLPEKAKASFDQMISQNRPIKAQVYFDGIKQMSPQDAALIGMQARLATTYLKYAESRIAQKQFPDAQRAIDRARSLNANAALIMATEEKLKVAQTSN